MKTIYLIINDISMKGGLSRVTLNLYEELTKRYSNKYNIKIISSVISDKAFNCNNDIVNLGLVSPHSLSKLNKLSWYIKFIYTINIFLKKENPDVVIGAGVMFNLCLSLYLTKKYKLFGAEHSFYGNNHKIIISLRKILYKRLDLIISLTKKDEKKYQQFHKAVVTIPNFTNFCDNKNFSTLDNKTLLYLGRFTTIKGVDILISIMIDFFKTNKEWTLKMYGEGPLKSEIRKRIIDNNLEKNIIVYEPTSNVKEALFSSSIYLMTSRSEGFPMVLLEAKAFGLPIVSFDCETGPAEIIKNNEDGFIIPIGDKNQFLNKLSLLVNDYKLRKHMGENAIKNVKEFCPDKIMKQWESLLDEKDN